MSVQELSREKTGIHYKNINHFIKSAISKKINHSRILYAGVNPENPQTMVVYKVVELFRGRYYYQETVFNPTIKSVHTTLTTINHEKFNKIIPAKDKFFQLRFYPNPQIVAATSYARELSGRGVFKNIIFKDYRNNQGFLTPLCDLWGFTTIKNYLS